jgi:hypothetical protein
MVRASVHMEYVSMRSWAIGHESIFDFPLGNTPASHHLQLDQPCLPYQNCGKGEHQMGGIGIFGGNLAPFATQESRDTRFP